MPIAPSALLKLASPRAAPRKSRGRHVLSLSPILLIRPRSRASAGYEVARRIIVFVSFLSRLNVLCSRDYLTHCHSVLLKPSPRGVVS